VRDTVLAGYVWSGDVGWIHLGDGIPTDAIRYANDSDFDYGVNVDVEGNLSGLAWSPNTGWINFGWTTPNDPYRPRFNLYNGYFFGYAWSANCGWVNLGNTRLKTDSIGILDTDGDGLSDAWEREKAGNLTTLTADGDADHDGMTDKDEYLAGTDPLDASSALRITALVPTGDSTTITWLSSPSRQYRIVESVPLLSGSWQLSKPDAVVFGDFGQTTKATVVDTNGAMMFYQILALPILAH